MSWENLLKKVQKRVKKLISTVESVHTGLSFCTPVIIPERDAN